MGGAGKKVNNFMGSDWGWTTGPLKLGYETLGGKKTFSGLLGSGDSAAAAVAPPPALPDITDQAIQLARDRERRRNLGGGTKSTFLSGVLGDQSAPSTFVKQLMGK